MLVQSAFYHIHLSSSGELFVDINLFLNSLVARFILLEGFIIDGCAFVYMLVIKDVYYIRGYVKYSVIMFGCYIYIYIYHGEGMNPRNLPPAIGK